VVAAETKKGLKLDTNAVKTHTGEGTIRARTLHDKGGEFELTHKPFLLVNETPNIDDVDPALKGRLHSVPFDRRWNRPAEVERDPALPDGDKELKAFLERPEELEGVLVLLVQAASEYYAGTARRMSKIIVLPLLPSPIQIKNVLAGVNYFFRQL
jgi:putative DNA primase/helicase